MHIEIRLLGNFNITLNGISVKGFRQPRRQTLLAYLLIHAGQPISRQTIAFLLWPDSSQKQAYTNLRNLIYKVRKALPEVDHYLELTNQTVRWKNGSNLYVDLLDFENSLKNAGTASTEKAKEANLERAVSLYAGDFLAGLYDEWILNKGSALKGQYKSALHQLTNFRWQYGDYPSAIVYAQRLLAADPLQESTYCLMMDVYLSQGDRGAALNVYHSCVTMLQEELGVDPSSATQQRYNQALHDSSTVETFVEPPSATVAVATPFVGRVEEQRRLNDAWAVTKLGRSRITFIHGVAGSGKTRLATEFVDSVKRKGGTALHARGYAAQGEALGVISALFFGGPIRQAIDQLDDIWYGELIRILPELLNGRPHLLPPAPITQRWEQQRFYEAISKAIVYMSDTIVIHLDDLQWFDSDSLNWLRFFMEYRHNSKIMLVATVRDDEIDENHPANLLHYDLARRNLSNVIELSPLTKEDVGALAAELSDMVLSDAALSRIQLETEGSPLYIIELVKSRIYADYVDGDGAQEGDRSDRELPEKIETVIKWRLGQLSKDSRKLVSVAAVIGRGFDYNLIDAIGSGLGVDVLSALDELWRRRLIAERESFLYDFAHDYIRDVAYAETSPILRRGLHKKTADAIREQHGEQLDYVSGQIAAHLAKAGDYKAARVYYEQAGDHALAQFSTKDAFDFFSSALVMWPEHERFARYSLHLKREAIQYLMLDLKAWKKELVILKELALLLQKDDAYGHRPLAQYLFRQGLYEKNSSSEIEAIRLFKQAIWLAKRYDHADIEAAVSHEIGMSYFNIAQYAKSRTALEHAIELAQKHQFMGLEGSALEDMAAVFLFSGEDINLLKRHLNRVYKLSQKSNDLILEARILNKLGYLPAEQGESDLAQAELNYLK
ncbi:MAG: BTAD domain-containing putative transcriptional regulator, partial [Chloroflexota bacterium]